MNHPTRLLFRYVFLSVLAFFLVFLSSCQSERSKKAEEIQRIMALCERYDTIPDLIRASHLVEYMEENGDARERQSAWRMMAKVYRRNHQPAFELQAIRMAIGCVDMAQPYDTLQMADCFYEWSTNLHNGAIYDEALKQLTLARELAEKGHDTVRSYVWLGESAWTFIEMGDDTQALQASDKAYRWLWAHGEKAKAVNARLPYITHQIEYNPSDSAFRLLREYSRLTDRDLESPRSRDAIYYWRMMGRHYQNHGNLDSAAYYYRKMLQNNSPNNEANKVGARCLYGLYKYTVLEDSAEFYWRKYDAAISDGVKQNKDNEYDNLAHEYVQRHRYIEQDKTNARTQRLLKGFLFAVLVVALLFLYRYIFLRRQYNEILEQNREFTQILESLNGRKLSDLVSTDIARHFHKLSSQDAHPTAAEWQTLQNTVQEQYPDFYATLARQYTEQQPGQTMTEQERRIVSLIAIKCSPLQMSVLLVCGKSNISNLRRRLYKKITGQDGSGSLLDKIIYDLCQ